MKLYAVIYASSLFLLTVDVQRVHYVNRFRNFSVESETGDFRLINATIYQDKMDHVLTGSFEIVRDIRVKSANVVIFRCVFETSACENFQRWKFNDKELKSTINMKNQMWTPLFASLTPKLDPPLLKKNIHSATRATLDAKAALVFYPDASKYFWRGDIQIIDIKERKVGSLFIETAFSTFVDRDRKRGGSSSKQRAI